MNVSLASFKVHIPLSTLLYQASDSYALTFMHMQMPIFAIFDKNAYLKDFETINTHFGILNERYA